MYSYRNNFIIDIAAEFIEKDDYCVLSMFMYVLKFETVSSCYLIKKSWKHFDIMITKNVLSDKENKATQ